MNVVMRPKRTGRWSRMALDQDSKASLIPVLLQMTRFYLKPSISTDAESLFM